MLTLKAYAKINLALDVLYKRADGYHEVAMIMQTVSLADIITLKYQPNDIELAVNINGLSADSSNLAYRAAALLKEHVKTPHGAKIGLEKHIPVAAGLAGGSADAAAVLRGLNILWDLNLSMDELGKLAAVLGSDVPFCLAGGTMMATGRGEALERVPSPPMCFVVLAKPEASISTAWVYKNFRADNAGLRPDIPAMLKFLNEGSLSGVAGHLANVLESVTIPSCPEIARIKQYMLEHGAMAALMSGSGPTVFGLTESAAKAEAIAAFLKTQGVPDVFVVQTVSKVE